MLLVITGRMQEKDVKIASFFSFKLDKVCTNASLCQIQ